MSEPYGWERFPETSSPITSLSKHIHEQLSIWPQHLKDTGFEFDEKDALVYWNMLSGIYSLTEFEKSKITATIAYELSGAGEKTGQRRFSDLKKQGLVVTKENPEKGTEKLVTVSHDAAQAVLSTLDAWTVNHEKIVLEYRRLRRMRNGVMINPQDWVDAFEDKF